MLNVVIYASFLIVLCFFGLSCTSSESGSSLDFVDAISLKSQKDTNTHSLIFFEEQDWIRLGGKTCETEKFSGSNEEIDLRDSSIITERKMSLDCYKNRRA